MIRSKPYSTRRLEQGSGVLDVANVWAHFFIFGVARTLTRSLSYWEAAAVHTLAKTTRAAAGESQVLNTWQKQIGVALAGHRSLLPPPTSQFSIVSTLRSAVPPPPPDNRCPLRSSPTPPFSPPGAHKPPSPRYRWPGLTISAAGTRRSKQTGSSRVSCQVFFLS